MTSVDLTKRPPVAHVGVNVTLNYASIKDVIEELTLACEGSGLTLTEAKLEIESYESYGSVTTDISVNGWRKATKQEVKDARENERVQKADNEYRQRERDEEMAAQIRERRPDLFILSVTEEP